MILNELTNGLFHPVKFKILKFLKDSKAVDEDSSLTFEEIADHLLLHRFAITAYLADLENYRLVASTMKVIRIATPDEKGGMMIAYYLSDELEPTLDKVQKMVTSLR